MKLRKIEGFPNYRFDLDTLTAYNVRDGIIRPCKTRTIYKCLTISGEGGKVCGTTIYRLAWCVQNNVAPDKIPKGFCITADGKGGVKVQTRSEANANISAKYQEKIKMSLGEVQKVVDMITDYTSGKDAAPFCKYLDGIAKQAKQSLVWMHGYCEERADAAVLNAEEKYLELIRKGSIRVNVRRWMFKTSLSNAKKHIGYNDAIRYGEIEIEDYE